jgi:hypothetical protein
VKACVSASRSSGRMPRSIDRRAVSPEQGREHQAVGRGQLTPSARAPGGTSSSPVETIATRAGGGQAVTVPTHRGERDPGRREARRRHGAGRPSAKSSPRRRTALPLGGLRRSSSRLSPSRAASSWTSTLSAPGGSGAPVKMRAPRPRRRAPNPARGALADHDRPRAGQIGEADGIAVHRGEVGCGLGAQGRNIARGPAACGCASGQFSSGTGWASASRRCWASATGRRLDTRPA